MRTRGRHGAWALGAAGVIVATSSIAVGSRSAHAATVCTFVPRVGAVTINGTYVDLKADAQGLVRSREWNSNGPWSPCLSSSGIAATLSNTKTIDIELVEITGKLSPTVALHLGVVLGNHEEGWASGMEKEQIAVHGPLAVFGVEASDAATQLTVIGNVVDLNGGWDNGPDGKLTIVDDDGSYAMTLDGGAGDDWFDATKAPKHVVLEGHSGDDVLYGVPAGGGVMGGPGNDFVAGGDGDDLLYGDDVPLANGGDVGGGDWVYGGGGTDMVRGGPGADHLDGGNGGLDHCYSDPTDIEVLGCETIN
jgi:Ca2+-binding RTX toxin-like protein